MFDLLTEPYYETFEFPEGGPAFFACNGCGRDVSIDPCPDHAPAAFPGLRLAECEATPKHVVFVHDRDDYGAPCPYCVLNGYWEKERLARQCRHWAWRRWKLTHKVCGWLYVLGVTSSGGGWQSGDGHNGCLPDKSLRLRGKRPYLLGVSRETWRCWLVGHHRRGEEVGFGFCGKCMPWPCCGAETADHKPRCPDA